MYLKSLLIFSFLTFAHFQAKSDAVACFTNFVYEGNDDFYKDNPLVNEHQFYNPVLPGWFSDPSIVRTGTDYFLVTSTFGYFPGIPIFHSTDLVNWIQVGNVLSRDTQLPYLKGQSLDKGGIYAPQISYNPANNTYYVITTDVGKGHFYVTAQDPFGAWSEPVFLDGMEGGIDPSFFFDEDGKAYIVYKEDVEGKPKWSDHRAIQIIRFNPETGQTFGPSEKFQEAGVAPDDKLDRDEGPHLYKINGKYFLLCAEGGTGNMHSGVIYRSDSVFGPYERWSRNPMLTQRYLKERRPNPISCAGHADLVQTPEGDWWAVFLGCRQNIHKFSTLGRETFLMPVKWSKDGFPFINYLIEEVSHILDVPGASHDTANTVAGNFVWTDDFGTAKLKPEWLSLWGSAGKFYKIESNCLMLTCAKADMIGRNTPAYIGRRIQHHKFKVDMSMKFNPASESDEAGLLMIKNEGHQYFLAIGKESVSLQRMNKDKFHTIVSQPFAHGDKEIGLRVISNGDTYDFYCRVSDGEWIPVATGIDASYLSQEKTGGFTGATLGMFAHKKD